jgi:exonuclease SbcD
VRILHTGDWHVGKTLRGKSRADEHRAVLQEIVELAKRNKVDVVIVAGDLFDAAAPTAESEKIVYHALLVLAQAVEHVIVISGNHDNPRRLEAIKPLLELTNIHVGATLERPADGGVIELKSQKGETVEIALFPFLSQRGIVHADELMTAEAYERIQTYQDRAARIIEQLCRAMSNKAINIFVGHAMLHGGVMGGGERSAHTVFEYSIPTTTFPAHLHYAAMGHLHRQQKLPGSCPIWYSGSPLQLDFGETEDTKAVNVIEAERGKPARVEQLSLRSGKRLRTIQGTMSELTDQAQKFRDDHLRIILKLNPAPGIADQLREKLPNIIDIKIQPPDTSKAKTNQTKSTTRLGRSPVELFSEYLDSVRERDEDVMRLFSDLLEEVYAADQA